MSTKDVVHSNQSSTVWQVEILFAWPEPVSGIFFEKRKPPVVLSNTAKVRS